MNDDVGYGELFHNPGRSNIALGAQASTSGSGQRNIFIGGNHVAGYPAKMVTPTADGFKPVIPDDSPQRTYPLLTCSYCGGGVPQDALKCVHCGAPPPRLEG